MNTFCRCLSNFGLLLALCGFLVPDTSEAAGTWAPLASGPPVGVNNCMLLGDGTVMGMNGAGQCVKLTPDIHGSYINGTWTTLATMNNARLFFASALLTNGNVFVAGGEYGPGHDHAELYDALNDTWTKIPDPVPGVGFSDAISKILPNGNVLVAPVSQFGGNVIYNVVSNNWQTAASTLNQNEVCWVKLPSDNIVTIDTGAQTSEHYVPSLNQWIADGNVPVPVFGYGAEIGAGFLLPNGKVFYIGGTTNTAIYTPGATVTSAGSWIASSGMPNNLGAVDAPAAMMSNGKILCDLGPVGGFNGPCSFYEYDYTSDTFTQVSAPGGGSTYNSVPYANGMLDLPDGTVLFVGGQNSGSLYIYTPDGTPLAAGKPVINSITQNLNGSYHVTGTGLNGISEGAAYGDDEQMDSNYPLVRMTNSVSGNVYYARTYNRSSTSVMTGSKILTTEFSVPQNLPAGTYSLVVVANGNPSAPQSFTYAPPTAPTGLAGTAGNAQTILSWNAVSGATSYNVKRLTTISPPHYDAVTTVTGTGCTNVGLVNGQSYYYAVSAVSPGGESTNSPTLLLVPFGPPPVPTGVTATVIPRTFADAQVNLTWLASYGATNYNIKRATIHNGPYTNVVGSVSPRYTDTNLLLGKTYYYVVSAVGTGGESSNSVEVSATIQVITNTCLPVTAADVVGSQVTFMATFNGTNLTYQWQKIVGVVTNLVAGATNTILTLSNLQLTDTASYQLRASNAVGTTFLSSRGTLTVNSGPAAVNNVIASYAAQTGLGNTFTNFVPTWSVAPGSLIANQLPSTNGSGDFSQYFTGTVSVLTDGTFGWLNFWPNVGSSPTEVVCGGSAGQFVTYTLTGSATGYNLTNITVYGGWGDAGRDQQAYTVYYSTITDPTNFIQLGSVNYNPANPSAVQSATRATLAPASGFLATNVAALKFDFTSPAPENGYCGYSEIDVFGSVPPPLAIAAYVVTNTLPATAVDVVGSQVTFTAAFSGTNPIIYQWQRIKSGVTNDIAGATNTILTLTNLQLTDTASYQLRASNVLGVAVSTPCPLTVNSVSAAVNNVVTSMAAQTGISGTTSFIPTWTVAQSGLIAGQSPNSVGSGDFSQGGSGSVAVLTDGSYGVLNYQPGIGGPSPSVVTCGDSGGRSVIYALSGSASGYSLTNITVYGGWGDAGRDQQAYTVYYSKITAPTTFIQLGSVNYNPANPSSTLSGTRATLTPSAGVLATNVAALKFDFTSPAPENGYCGYAEINVFGVPTPLPPPPPWVAADIGSVGVAGSASYLNGVFTVAGSGANIAGTADAFRYVYQPISGNCDIRARVVSIQNTSAGAKAGVMIRESLTSNSRSTLVDVTPGNGVEFIRRTSTGGNASATTVAGLSAPYWVRLVRSKNTFTAYDSSNGTTWTKVGTSQNITMATNIYVGLAVCSQNNAVLCTATFDNVMLPTPPVSVYPPPQLVVGSGQTGGAFTFQFQGVNDLNYTVETSTNLADWTAIFTNALTDADAGVFTFTNPAATDATRFYRVAE